jgi:VWFA-related protein
MLEIADKIFKTPPAKDLAGRRAIVALTDGVDSVSESEFAEVRQELQSKGVTSYFVQVNTQDFFEDRLLGDCDDPDLLRFSPAQMRRYYKSFVSSKKVERKTNFCELGEFERLAISKKLYEVARFEMKDLSDKSGGKIFPVESLREANAAFKQVATEIGTQYSLGYYSSNEKRDGTFRKIRVELKGIVGAKIQAREGYTAPKD